MPAAEKQETPPRSHFATTKWNLVREAGTQPGESRERALEALMFHYRPALCEFLRRKYAYSEPYTEDLVQGFILDKVLRKNLIAKASQARGKFRTFLATAINAYATDVHRHDQSKRRHPRGGLTVITEEIAQQLSDTPDESESLFNEALIRQIIAESLHETRAYCSDAGIPEAWTILNERVLNPIFEDIPRTSFEQLTERMNLKSVKEARNKLVSAKRVFQRQLRQRITEFSASAEEAEAEIAFLSRFLTE